MSDAIPNFHGLADDFCVINSMTSTNGAHEQGQYILHTSYALRGTIDSLVTSQTGVGTGLPTPGPALQVAPTCRPGEDSPHANARRHVVAIVVSATCW